MTEPIKIVRMVNTCHACPSQWDGWDGDGTYYYFRYRWGYLSVRLGAVLGEDSEEIFSWSSDDGWDGVMSYETLRTRLSGVMVLPDTDYEK